MTLRAGLNVRLQWLRPGHLARPLLLAQCVLVVAALELGASTALASSFRVIGPLPGLDVPPGQGQKTFSTAAGLSDDGRVAVGLGLVHAPGTTNPTVFENVPFRDEDGVLEDLTGQLSAIQAQVTGDGSRVLVADGAGFWTWEGANLTFTDLSSQVSTLVNVSGTTPDGGVLVG